MLKNLPTLPPPPKSEFKIISLDLIDDPQRPIRQDLTPESVADLVVSMRQVGIIEPLVVKRVGERCEVIAGHRRLVAAAIANLVQAPCFIVEATKEQAELLKIHENLYRAEVRPSDEAKHFQYMMDTYKISPTKLAQLVGKSDTYVTDRLNIFNYPPALKEALDTQKIKFSVAREFYRMEDQKKMNEYLYYAIRNGITSNLARQWVNDYERSQQQTLVPASNEANPVTPSEYTETISKCVYCQQGVGLSKAILVYMHPECYNEISKPPPETQPQSVPEQ